MNQRGALRGVDQVKAFLGRRHPVDHTTRDLIRNWCDSGRRRNSTSLITRVGVPIRQARTKMAIIFRFEFFRCKNRWGSNATHNLQGQKSRFLQRKKTGWYTHLVQHETLAMEEDANPLRFSVNHWVGHLPQRYIN
jgi:hypothetical protein